MGTSTGWCMAAAALAAFACAAAAQAQNSWEVVSPGMNGTDYRFVATLDPANNGGAFVEMARPTHATHFKASFWLDPSGLNLPEGGSNIRFMNLVDDSEGGSDPHSGVISVGFIKHDANDHQWHVVFWNLDDSGGYQNAVNKAIGTSFPAHVEIELWTAGTGSTSFCARNPDVPGSDVCNSSMSMLNADVDSIRFGLFNNSNPSGITGSFAIDGVSASW